MWTNNLKALRRYIVNRLYSQWRKSDPKKILLIFAYINISFIILKNCIAGLISLGDGEECVEVFFQISVTRPELSSKSKRTFTVR